MKIGSLFDDLYDVLQHFEVHRARKVSRKIHRFEASGGKVTPELDRLWMRLTNKIEKCQ